MAKRRRATGNRKSPKRKKQAEPAETEGSSAKTPADAKTEEQEAAAAKKTDATAKRKRAGRRSRKRRPAATEPDRRVETAAKEKEAQTAREQTAAAEQPKPAPAREGAKKRRRKRRISKTARGTPAAQAETVAETPSRPRVTPVSPTAEVVQDDDSIVIRFPAATPPARPAAPAPGDPVNPVIPDEGTIEPPIDWEVAEEPPAAADEPPLVADEQGPPAELAHAMDHSDTYAAPPTPPEGTDEIPEPQAGTKQAEPTRAKRRRRRKKKDPRLAPEAKTPADEGAAVEPERRRPEPADKVEPVTEQKAARRRRRRSRRGRKPEPTTPAAAPGKPGAAADSGAPPLPSGQKEMIINVVPREECRIAIMQDGKLQEIYLERASAENYVGNIYKGIVTNVEPSIQAAFVDFGLGKNGFLHISDLHPQYFPDGEGNTEDVGRKMPRRSRPPIQRCLRRGQQLLVQITKEGIGTKGPTLTTYLSIPGRFLVMMPGMRQLGVSRKIEDEDARRKLRDQLHELNLPGNIGFIARTAALDRTKRELQSDLNYLSRLWRAVEKRIKDEKPPAEIYTESDLVIRTIRDVYTSDITRIVVDHPDVAQRADEFLSIFSPRSRDTVVEYDDPEPIFHRYGIEAELERLHSRHVPLKSGGSLVIDQTEALVAIDVNSGRFRTEEDAETTAFKINLEAADEIPRQLRLRDLGGVVICDLIDMRQEKHKREIERRLTRNLKQHKERAKLLRTSAFGIIELTRQRQRASLTRSVYQDCQHCHGSGLVKTAESVVLDVMRLIQLAVTRDNIRAIEVSVSREVGHLLQNRKRSQLHDLEARNQRSIWVRVNPAFGLDEIAIQCYDPRGRVVPHP